MSDWKQDFADDASEALKHELVKETVDEYVDNMRNNFSVDLSKGLAKYGLYKVMNAVGIVARAQALGIDPDLMRLSNEEATADIIEMAKRFHAAGKPVFVVETEPK